MTKAETIRMRREVQSLAPALALYALTWGWAAMTSSEWVLLALLFGTALVPVWMVCVR